MAGCLYSLHIRHLIATVHERMQRYYVLTTLYKSSLRRLINPCLSTFCHDVELFETKVKKLLLGKGSIVRFAGNFFLVKTLSSESKCSESCAFALTITDVNNIRLSTVCLTIQATVVSTVVLLLMYYIFYVSFFFSYISCRSDKVMFAEAVFCRITAMRANLQIDNSVRSK